MQLSDISRSYQEVEMFYTSGINTALNQFGNFGDEGEKLKTDVIEHEFADLDSTYIKLQEELSLQPGDERIIDAMIIHYRTKLEIVNRIISQLENVKSLKPNKHETKEI